MFSNRPEFCEYTFNKESELWKIYRQLDLNHDMRLDKNELRLALNKSSIHLNDENFEQFFKTLDQNNSGSIEVSSTFVSLFYAFLFIKCKKFADFRDYLLLLPRHPHITEIYRYYQIKNQSRGASQVTSDGDVS